MTARMVETKHCGHWDRGKTCCSCGAEPGSTEPCWTLRYEPKRTVTKMVKAPDALANLAHNLATVAALEFAFWLGTDWAEWANDPHPDPAPFHPGRNRPAPGWEGK